LVEQFCRDSWDATPTATPYRSGVPIDSIAPSTNADDSPAQLRRTEAYQSLIGSIGWLATATRPDLAPVHSFLSSYNCKPSSGHMRAALHVFPYIHSTHDFGIHFTSSSTDPAHTFIPWMLRLIRTPSHLYHLTHLLSLPTVMPVGALKLGLRFVTVLCFLYSNVGA
jgi:hypothetical protein